MKIAFVGKGGSGKTTLSALFSRYLAHCGVPVVAIDADINQHLGTALGASPAELSTIPPLGSHLTDLKEILRGRNPRIASAEQMVKTTPPGRFPAPRPLRRQPGAPALRPRHRRSAPHAHRTVQRRRPGVSCYHSKVGAVEMYLNHLVDGPGEYVVVDMTAGADSFASGLFTRFDVTFLVAEPTVRGVGVYRQYVDYARDYDVTVHVIGNKVHGPDDVEFLRDHVGDALTVCLTHSGFVRAMEKGRFLDLAELEEDNLKALARMRDLVDAAEQDWEKFTRQTVEFHLRNAEKWANAATGVDLAAQVDPEFTMGPEALAASRQWC